MLVSLARAFQQGGPFMYGIGLVSAFALAIIVERVYYLYFKYDVKADKVWPEILNYLMNGDIKGAIKIGDDVTVPFFYVIRHALENIDTGKIQDFALEAQYEVEPEVNRRISYVSLLANIATLLGLLGTITGLIAAFMGVAAADPGEKQKKLASGIATAMNTTAFGLIVAIPCLIAFSILQAKADSILNRVEEYSKRLVDYVTHNIYNNRVGG